MYERITRRYLLKLEGYSDEEAEFLAEVASNHVMGRKKLYFMSREKCDEIINKYKDVLLGSYTIEEIESSKGLIYRLDFIAKHTDANEIYEKENAVYMTYRPHRNGKPSGPREKKRFIC